MFNVHVFVAIIHTGMLGLLQRQRKVKKSSSWEAQWLACVKRSQHAFGRAWHDNFES